MASVLVMVPTYNESGNAERLCRQILSLRLDLDILFVDDNSTDGTGQIIDALARETPRVLALHRPGKLGVGSAHAAGIRWAYEHGYDRLLTMDCDFTHDPREIPTMLQAGDKADVVVGSRYLRADSLSDWNPYRKTLTRTGHLLTRTLLGMPYDATNAFRLYNLKRIPKPMFGLVASTGYSFFFESLYAFYRNGLQIVEVPMALPKRTYGSSKMGVREISNSVTLLGSTWFKARFNPEKFQLGDEVTGVDGGLSEGQGWDEYWNAQKQGVGGLLYDAVAAIYRKWIIRPTLNRFAQRYFAPNDEVLHAGCGSGQVDEDLRLHVRITALDISLNALRLYSKVNGNRCRVLHGSIFDIPLSEGSVDGVYNLGVMEHFSEEEIGRILGEFRRVVRPGGRALIFWPPEFGASVLFFKALGWVFRNLLRRKNVKFHPDEITRVRSKRHMVGIFEEQGWKVIDYYFGPRDLFTYAVAVAERPIGASVSANVADAA